MFHYIKTLFGALLVQKETNRLKRKKRKRKKKDGYTEKRERDRQKRERNRETEIERRAPPRFSAITVFPIKSSNSL